VLRLSDRNEVTQIPQFHIENVSKWGVFYIGIPN